MCSYRTFSGKLVDAARYLQLRDNYAFGSVRNPEDDRDIRVPEEEYIYLAVIRREMKRRAAVEPTIGHLKIEHRMGRNYLKGRTGDRINAVLAAAGYNFSLLLRWLAALLRALITLLLGQASIAQIA